MRLFLRLVIAAALVSLCFVAPASMAGGPQQPDVDAILQHLDDLYRSKSSIARIEVDVTTARSTRNMRLRAWTRGEEEVLVLIEAPPREAGTATLRVGNNPWNYLPKIARTIRVPHETIGDGSHHEGLGRPSVARARRIRSVERTGSREAGHR